MVETFDLTKYGMIDGAVTNVSNDAMSLGQNGQQRAKAVARAQKDNCFP